MMLKIPAILCAFLCGCASTVEIPKEVKVPVPVACIALADKPQRPPLRSDAELLALDSYKWAWAVWSDRATRQGYEAELEAVVDGCSRIPALTTPARN